MHQVAFDLMSRFVEAYLGERDGATRSVIEVGSRTAAGGPSHRHVFPQPPWRYRGLDVAPGENVDIIAYDPYRWSALQDASVDVAIAGHALARAEFPWETLREIARILRPGGLVCLIVPSTGPERRDPRDCWRVYPDGIVALAKHAALRVVEVFTAWGLGEWQDTFAVLQKPRSSNPEVPPAFPEAVDRRVALRFYLEAFGTRPSNACYYLNVARLMLEVGRLAKAAAALRTGLEVVPGHPGMQRMQSNLENLAAGSQPALEGALAALGVRPLTIEAVSAAANFFDGASAIERRLLIESQLGDGAALRQIAMLAELAQRYGFAAQCWEAVASGSSGALGDLLSWALNSRAAGFPDAAKELFRRTRDMQLDKGVVNRTTIVQRLIQKLQARTYLEIGVERGPNLFQIEVPMKFAVDPDFRIPGGAQDLDGTRFFASTSDAFFASPPRELLERGLDVVLVDGLHTADQALRDVENSLRFLNPGGVIVMHDCLPASEAQACADLQQARKIPGFNGDWTGDVFRTIVRLRATRQDLFVCVVDTDHGVGIVTRGNPESTLSLDEAKIDAMNYAELRAAQEILLNVKPAAWFDDWLAGIGPNVPSLSM